MNQKSEKPLGPYDGASSFKAREGGTGKTGIISDFVRQLQDRHTQPAMPPIEPLSPEPDSPAAAEQNVAAEHRILTEGKQIGFEHNKA